MVELADAASQRAPAAAAGCCQQLFGVLAEAESGPARDSTLVVMATPRGLGAYPLRLIRL